MYPKGPIRLMYRLYRHTFPKVKIELDKWRVRAANIPDSELRKQALASIENKTFHCEGGCVYAAASMEHEETLIPLIVAYQTISDYLDNLCDRSSSLHEDNFTVLHQAMLDAVSLKPLTVDYYTHNDQKNDGEYLRDLVLTCQMEISKLPNYHLVKDQICLLARLYCELQVNKHLDQSIREEKLLSWWKSNHHMAPQLFWNEFAAATGSTLGIFHLLQVAAQSNVEQGRVHAVSETYFPWLCALHILLDYLIDIEEDSIGEDLNFISYYRNPAEIEQRLSYISNQARHFSKSLPDFEFHHMIIDGLLGLYLSDGKVLRQPMVIDIAKKLIDSSPFRARFFFWNGRGYRGRKAVLQLPPTRETYSKN